MADTIQEYLVRLGFQVDQSQQNRFSDGLKSVRTQMEGIEKVVSKSISGFMELATAAGGTAIAIATALGKIALGMAQMSFQSQKVGASAANIHALGFAFTQAGGSIEDANSALESYSTLLRELPGQETSIKQQFGIAESVTDRAEQLVQIGAEFRRRVEAAGPVGLIQRDMAVATQRAIALRTLGLTEDQFLKMIRPQFSPAFAQARETEGRIGTNWDEAARKGEEYRKKLNEIRDSFANLRTFVYNEFADGMNAGMGKVADFLKAHDRQIGLYLRNMRQNFDTVTSAIVEWYKGLSEGQKTGVVVGGGGALAAGGGALIGGILTKLGVPGGPQIAALGALSLAIITLSNDYETWKRTSGKGSLIDWSFWEPGIQAATAALKFLDENVIGPLFEHLGLGKELSPIFLGFAALLAATWVPSILKSFGLIGAGAVAMWSKVALITTVAVEINKALEALEKFFSGAEEVEKRRKFREEHSPIWDFLFGRTDENDPSRSSPSILRRLFPGSNFSGGGTGSGPANFQPLADTTTTPDMKRFLDATSIAESGGDYNIVNPKSQAAGRYQFLPSTNAEVSAQTGITGFDPVSQDRKAGFYARQMYKRNTGRDLDGDLKDRARWPSIGTALNKIWTSLPGGAESRMTPEQWMTRMSTENAGATVNANATARAPTPSLPTPAGDMVNRLRELGVTAPPPSGMTTPPPPPPAVVPPAPNNVSFNSSPNITVNGVSDPQLAANYVERASQRQNADVLRRLRPVYA